MKKLFLLLFLAAVVAVILLIHGRKPEVQTLQKRVHSSFEQTQQAVSNVVKEGAQKANALKTHATGEFNAGARKMNELTTNTFAKAKEIATNVFDRLKKSRN